MTSDEANGCSSKARIPSSSPTSARCRNEIDQPLVGRVGVDGRHLAVTDAGGRVEHFATGARQFVVHDAFAITSCRTGWYASKLTPRTNVGTPSLASAEMITLRSRPPVSGCGVPRPELARRLDHDVDSEFSPRKAAGSLSVKTRISCTSTSMAPGRASTAPGNRP